MFIAFNKIKYNTIVRVEEEEARNMKSPFDISIIGIGADETWQATWSHPLFGAFVSSNSRPTFFFLTYYIGIMESIYI